jgi:serine/threonine-protein kinase
MTAGIDPQRWSHICAVFDELIDVDAATQGGRLDEIGARDPDLRRCIEKLLAADADAGVGLARVDSAFALSLPGAGERRREADPLKLAGCSISHFNIIEPLATGGMGVVYRAQDTNLQRTIALKFPLPSYQLDRGTKERFLHEARSAGALDHPNICGIYETGETDDGQLFLAMPLYDGETLKARLTRAGALAVADALSIAKQIADGLGAAHQAGIVHRDVKPANVMLLRDGTVKVLDFGLAKVRDLTLTEARARVGTVSYMAPEQVAGQPIDGRADLWALGVILYEMLTGRRPFEGEYDVSIAHAIVHTEPVRAAVLRREITPDLDDVVWQLLRKDPVARFASAADVAAQLTASAPGAPVRRRLSQRRTFGSGRLRSAPRTAGVALTVLAAIALGAWLLRRSDAGALEAPRTIAVLPFEDPSNTAESRYVAVGLGDAITTGLSRLRLLIVPSYISTDGYRGTTKPPSQIAHELSAAAVVKGSVLRMGDRIRVDAQLIDANTNEQLWVQRYERPLTELLDIGRDATKAIIAALNVNVTDAERALIERPPTTNAQAYDLYLRGREVELRGTPLDIARMPAENIREAQSLYSRAREIDPTFALARARLALTQMYSVLKYDRSPARLEQARLEAEAAVRLQPGLPEAHEALAFYWGPGVGDDAKAIEEFKRALEGVPNSADYHLNLGTSYNKQGRWEEAVAEFDRAMQLEPLSPGPAFNAALANNRLRRYEKAIKAWDRVIALVPDDHLPKLIKGYAYVRWQGSADTLAAVLERIPADWDTNGMATWSRFSVARLRRRHNDALAVLNGSRHTISFDGFVYRPIVLLRGWTQEALGDRARARANYEAARSLLADSVAVHPDDPRIRIALGLAYAGLGRKQQAVQEARRAMELAPLSQNNPRATAFMGGAAEVLAQAGDTDGALELLELLLAMPAGREASVPLLRVDPIFDPLRSDPRFEQLLKRFSTD